MAGIPSTTIRNGKAKMPKIPTKVNPETGEEEINWTKIDTPIEHEGKRIVLPSDPGKMEVDDAITSLINYQKQENQKFDVRELVAGAPWDTLAAVFRATQEIYGIVLSESIQTWFGEIKPEFVTIVTGPNEADRIQVPSGRMSLPGVDDPIHVEMKPGGTLIHGTVRKCDRARLVDIANLARKIILEQSVYKGKAIRLNVDDYGDLQLDHQPEFLDLSRVQETDVIHNQATEEQIATNIFAPLKFTAAARANNIPLKRGILLEGPFGTGKSLTARVTAKVAINNGWTFIMLNRCQGLRAAIEFARQYQPCVIFAEDIDRAASDRSNEEVNDLVNILDGVVTKDMEMMVVLTTNSIEKIEQVLLRPGRFDAIISIDRPNAEAAQRVIRAYAGDLLDPKASLEEVGVVTAGMIPSAIREVVERAKLSMLTQGRTTLTAGDLKISAVGMARHMALLAPKDQSKSTGERLVEALAHVFRDALTDSFDLEGDHATEDGVRHARDQIMGLLSSVYSDLTQTKRYASAGADSSYKALEEGKKAHVKLDVIQRAVE